MIKKFEQRKSQALSELKELNAKETLSTEERAKIDTLKNEVEAINQRIKDLQFADEQEREKAKGAFKNENKVERNNENIVEKTNSEFTKYLRGEQVDENFITSKGNFRFSSEYFNKRATVTKAGDSSKLSSVFTLPVDIIEKKLVLYQLGAPAIQFVSGGAFKAPYLSSAPATFNSEDNSNADQSWSAGAIDLIPNHISASYELSGSYLKSISPVTIDYIVNSLLNRVYQGIEKKAIDNIISNVGSTSTGTTWYSA